MNKNTCLFSQLVFEGNSLLKEYCNGTKNKRIYLCPPTDIGILEGSGNSLGAWSCQS